MATITDIAAILPNLVLPKLFALQRLAEIPSDALVRFRALRSSWFYVSNTHVSIAAPKNEAF